MDLVNYKYYHIFFTDANNNLPRTIECKVCEKPSRFSGIKKDYLLVLFALVLTELIYLFVFPKTVLWVKLLMIINISTIIFLPIFFIQKNKSLMPCDPKTHKILDLQPNTRVIINSPKYIKPYGVYGLKFKAETTDKRFHEAFSDGLVPAVFHPNEKGSLAYNVRIINRSFVPDELLFDGAKFLVEDSDGIFIAKGTIENSNLDY